MHARHDPPQTLLSLAARQGGVLSTEQIARLRYSEDAVRRLLKEDSWQRVAHGVYATGDVDWTGQLWAGVLLGGPEARIGGEAAGHLHGIAPQPEQIQVLVPESSPICSRPPWVFRRERPGVRSPRSPGEPPRLTLPDTTLDLCEAAAASEVVSIVTRAVGTRRTSSGQLRSALQSRSRMRHRQLLTGLLGDIDAGARSWLEIRYLHDVERAHGLPRGDRQSPSHDRRCWRDILYTPYRLVVELDGRIGHEGEGKFRDMRRDNVATLAGESTLRYGHGDVTSNPCRVAFEVAAVLTHLGWSGVLRRCPRCSAVPVNETA